MSVLENRQRNALEKMQVIVDLITEELRVHLGDDALRLIGKILDILDEEKQ